LYIDKLVINGFKSFADKLELVFEPAGITTVVGPNGCGKSNISDAIRWSLGEQSAKALRCKQMSDLIFNGGVSSKPLEKAEVAIKFGGVNGEISLPNASKELTIQRQLYQSGESRYYINKEQCLLREINELFMGTGVGVSAYSVMEQSKIDLILNTRPEERRFLFDEVAGITKYKYRKKEALKKLEETEQNILRINDVIHELKRQTESLKIQAERAEKYIQLKDHLKEFEFEFSRRQYDEFDKQISDTQVKLNDVQKEKDELENSIKEMEEIRESVKSTQKDLSEKIESGRNQFRMIEDKIKQIESRISIYKERQENIQKQRERAIESINEMKNQLEELDTQKQSKINEKQKIEVALKIDESKLTARERVIEKFDRRIKQSEKEISELEKDIDKIVEESTKLRGESSGLQNKLKYSIERLDKLVSDLDQMKLELSVISKNISESKEELDKLEKKITRSISEQKAVQESIKEERKNLEELDSKIRQTQEMLGQKASRLQSLEQLQQSYEGYYAGVRSILLAKENSPAEFSGICGVIAEIIKTEPDYEIAIEVALGSAIQNVVVEASEDAQKGISFLKQNRSGRVTFLPLDIIQPRFYKDSEAILNQSGVLGLAYELLQYDYKYDVAIKYLLGNTIVVEDLDTAIYLRRNKKCDARLVTIEGELIGTSGAITGGYSKSMSSGLLQRTREIEELKRTVKELNAQMSKFDNQRENLLKTLNSSREHLQELSDFAQSLKVKYAEAKKEFEQKEQQQKWLNEQIKSIQEERAYLEKEKNGLESDQLELIAKLEEFDKNKQNLQRQMQRLNEENNSEKEKREEVKKSFTDLRIQLAEKREKIQSIEDSIKSVEANKVQTQDRIQRFENDLKNDEQIRKELIEKISQAQHEFLLLEQKKFDESEKISKLESEQSEQLESINNIEKGIRALQRRLNKASSSEHSLEVKLTRLDMQKEALEAKFFEKYNTSLEQLKKQVEDSDKPQLYDMDEHQLNFEIDKLKAQIDDMGKVNLMAIDEYDEHKNRLKFMDAQRNDLKKSTNDTYKVIEKINKLSRQEFMESFEKIKNNFQEIFQTLFGGGDAELCLTNGDLLEAGVEITARPPGKKPKTISALSGGERTLVAIALLFAIFKLKPSPFCVLDEVDASLDDANVIRFTNLVKEFAKQTQFIIITHNKRTMEIADVMYGVTMEDAGISKIVSLKINA